MTSKESLKIVEQEVSDLQQGFEKIYDNLNLANNENMEATRNNVGHERICKEIDSFNRQISDTKDKFKRKTENLIDFLKEVKTGSTEADAKIAKQLDVE